ncbi:MULTISPECIES: phospholipase D family protein [unclassified Fibrobacter]|uniref:phospholipase D family protein n=1 Tax=unclassified Fibrobacter TaxID=2634177 RepID=UPI0025BE2177|nr:MULTISPECIES: phospholipase D family protein [unclassified Fibrobacter]
MLVFDEIEKDGTIKSNVGNKFREWLRDAVSVKIACPFISESLKFKIIEALEDKDVRLVCDLENAGCNPITIQKILEEVADENNVRYFSGLHAKVYIFDDKRLIITSANYSKNGMGCGTLEAANFIDTVNGKGSKAAVDKAVDWFDGLFDKSLLVSEKSDVEWDRLKSRFEWNKKRIRQIEKEEIIKDSVVDLLKLGKDVNDVIFVLWSEDDDGYPEMQESIEKNYGMKFDFLTEVLPGKKGERKKELHFLDTLYKTRIRDKDAIICQLTHNDDAIRSGCIKVGKMIDMVYRKGNTCSRQSDADSVCMVYKKIRKGKWIYELDSSNCTLRELINSRIRDNLGKWEKLVDAKKDGYVTFAEMQKFLGYRN